MQVWRITAARFADHALSGFGAAQAGARWNSRGTALAYTADSAALAMLEMLVHVDRADVPAGTRLLAYEVPDDAIVELHPLPPGWQALPYALPVQAAGDRWVRAGHSLALRVPSVIAPGHANLLVNPAHARFAEVRRLRNDPLAFDPRLFAR
jgi:RES domain-containing protein